MRYKLLPSPHEGRLYDAPSLFAGKTLAILSGGGDTPAINSSIEAVRNRASMLGFKVYGIHRGWKGQYERCGHKFRADSLFGYVSHPNAVIDYDYGRKSQQIV